MLLAVGDLCIRQKAEFPELSRFSVFLRCSPVHSASRERLFKKFVNNILGAST
jgi:hypothetical protein